MLCGADGHPNDSESHGQGVITLTPLYTPELILKGSGVLAQPRVSVDQSRSLPSPRGVRQSSFAASELGTAPSTTLMLPAVTAPGTSPHPLPYPHLPGSRRGPAPSHHGYLVCDGCCPGTHIWTSRGSGRPACRRFGPVRARKEKAMSPLPPRGARGGGGTTHSGT